MLLLRQSRQNLPDQAGALLPVQGQLRLDLRVEVRQLRRLRLLPRELRKGQRQLFGHFVGGDVHRDPAQPGQKGLVGLQLVQTLERPQITVLQNVPAQVLVPDHGADGPIQNGAGLLVQLRKGGLVACLGPGCQLRGELRLRMFFCCLLLHAFHCFFLSIFYHSSAGFSTPNSPPPGDIGGKAPASQRTASRRSAGSLAQNSSPSASYTGPQNRFPAAYLSPPFVPLSIRLKKAQKGLPICKKIFS